MLSRKNVILSGVIGSALILSGCSSDDELPEVTADFTFACADYSQALAKGDTRYAREMLSSAKETLSNHYTEDTIPQGYYREYLTKGMSGIIMIKSEVKSICASAPGTSLLNAVSIAANNSYQLSLEDLSYSICAHLNSGHTSFDDFQELAEETEPSSYTAVGRVAMDYQNLLKLASEKGNDDFTDDFLEESLISNCEENPFKSTFGQFQYFVKIAKQKTYQASR